MTYSLSEAARLLLQPDAYYRADVIANDPKLVPNVPGLYGWWFDGAIPDLPLEGSHYGEGRRLLYVGIAPSGARGTSGKRTLRDRLKNHCRGPIAHSTVRRTLVSLVGTQLGFSLSRRASGKLAITPDNERELTAWMGDHLRVAWMPHPKPKELEEALISGGTPRLPLNIKGSHDPFAQVLKQRRAILRGARQE